jgi:glycosyltransferase involved in cell wall biosynthesis
VRIAFLVPSPAACTGPSLGPASGGYLYDERMAAGLRALGNDVALIWTARSPGRAEVDRVVAHLHAERHDAVLEDELGFETYAAVNAHLRVRGAGAALVGLIHVPTALLEPVPTSADAERRFLSTLDAAVYVSRSVRCDAEAVLGARVPSHVVPPGADPPAMRASPRRAGASTGPLHLISVGHLLPHKGYLELADVLRRLASDASAPGWTASWIGDLDVAPAYRDAVLARLHRASLLDRVRLTGRLPAREVARALASADLFVTASRYESHGLAVTEALEAGVPVAGWTAGGLWEYLRPGRDSIQLPWGDVDRFAETLRRLLEDRELRAALAEGAVESARALAPWSQRASEMEAALESILAARRKGSRHAAE